MEVVNTRAPRHMWYYLGVFLLVTVALAGMLGGRAAAATNGPRNAGQVVDGGGMVKPDTGISDRFAEMLERVYGEQGSRAGKNSNTARR